MVGRAIQVNGHFFTLFGSLGSFCIIWLECPERNNEGETSLLSLAWCLLMERKKHNYHHPFQFETLKSKHKEIVLLFCLLSCFALGLFFFFCTHCNPGSPSWCFSIKLHLPVRYCQILNLLNFNFNFWLLKLLGFKHKWITDSSECRT